MHHLIVQRMRLIRITHASSNSARMRLIGLTHASINSARMRLYKSYSTIQHKQARLAHNLAQLHEPTVSIHGRDSGVCAGVQSPANMC